MPIYITWMVSSTGSYIFTWLAGGTYIVSYTGSSIYIPEIANPWTVSWVVVWLFSWSILNALKNIVVDYWDDSINNNFWLAVPATINWVVWYDMNADMMTWWSEIYTSWAKVVVTYENSVEWSVTKTLFTDSFGNWSLTGLQSGSTYTVSIDMSYGPANGYRLTTNNVTYSGVVGYAQSKFVW
jgi:hypothetical protein